MTIRDFADQNNKNIKTVINWITQGFMPGANLENNYIPNSARQPYTEAKGKAKKVQAIYFSIVQACKKRKHVFPGIYGITETEFNNYINQLINNGLITKRYEDGVTYYDATIEACKQEYKELMKFIATIATCVPKLSK